MDIVSLEGIRVSKASIKRVVIGVPENLKVPPGGLRRG